MGKDANAYPDAKSQAHVQVALRLLAKGQSAKSGDVIPHIFCLPEDGVSATSNKAINAYHPDEVRKKGSNLQIGKLFFFLLVFMISFFFLLITFLLCA